MQVEWYEEDYTAALNSLHRAHELEPTWQECRTKFEECHKFLVKLSQMIRTKGQLNQRRLNTLMAVGLVACCCYEIQDRGLSIL